MAKMLTFSVHELLLMLLYLEWPDLLHETILFETFVFRREIEKQLVSALYYALTANTGCFQIYLTLEQAKEILKAIYFVSEGGTWLNYMRSDPHIRVLETAIYRKLRSIVS